MLSENEVKNLLEKGTLIEYLEEDVRKAKFKENRLLGFDDFHFMNSKGNCYCASERLNKQLNEWFQSNFKRFFLEQVMSLERTITNKEHLVFPDENIRLKVLKKEHERLTLEIEKNVNEYEFLYFDESINLKCISLFARELDKILFIEDGKLKWSKNWNPFEKDTELYIEVERDFELLSYCFRVQWLKEQIGLESEIQNMNKVGNLKKPEIEKEVDNSKKIMVNCTPAQFATILEILMDKDYLQKRSNAEGTAKLLLKIFEFKNNNPSFESLGKVLFKEERKINAEDYEDLNKIIHRKYLKGNKD